MSSVLGVQILAPIPHGTQSILTPQALSFIATLHRVYNPIRRQLLVNRILRQEKIEQGHLPDFLRHTKSIRDDPAWSGPSPAPGLVDRRVEITGPVDRKMVINALNSGATQFMADFEDSSAPTWENMVNGQKNIRDAIHREISYTAPNGKSYQLKNNIEVATLLVRPRGWHLEEKHVLIDGSPCSASIFDFGLYFFHNAKKSVEIGQGPYYYLPKLESHLEARLWNDIFNTAQDMIGMTRGTIRATVLIETLMAAFEMEEIIYELRQHSAGLNCGRWDYIFSVIKKFRNNPAFVLPQRSDVTMTSPFMDAYVRLLIKTCHKRGVHAMGGMAAQIPSKDPKVNEVAMTRVRADKFREAQAGHDGTWVAHPDLVKLAMDVFNEVMPQPNQLHIRRDEVKVTAKDLLNMDVKGKVTEDGIRNNVSVGLAYIEAWLRGSGCVPIHNLMEDAATAEISRSQLWQWVKHDVRTDTGILITSSYLDQVMEKEISEIKEKMGQEPYRKSKFDSAAYFLRGMVNGRDYPEFLTSMCYDQILSIQRSRL